MNHLLSLWNRGRTFLEEQYATKYPSFAAVRSQIQECLAHRVPGTSVFIASSPDHVPPILVHFVKRCRSLHESVILLTVRTEVYAHVPPDKQYETSDLGDGFWTVVLHFGYMEHPRVAERLREVVERERLLVDLNEITYYIGKETLTATNSGQMGRIAERIFAYLRRNAVEVESTFCLPPQQVVEIGTQIDL